MLKIVHNFVEKLRSYIYIYIYIYSSSKHGLKSHITKNKSIRIIGFISSFALLLLAIISIFPITHKPDQAEATPDASVSTVTITSSSSTANVDIVPTSSTGTFASSDTNSEVAFGVTTNNLTGYNLVIEGSDATGVLTNDNTGDTLTTIDSSTDETTFITGASSTYTNKWGIKPSKLNSVTNTNYLPAPTTTNTITMDTTDVSNPTTANNYTIGLGARIDYEKPSGTYTNTFNIQAVARPMMYEIVYSDGGVTGISNIPATESNTAAIAGVILPSTPTRSDTTYTFAGWCDGTTNTTTVYDSTDEIYYNPGTLCNGASAYNTTNPNPDVYPGGTSYKFNGKTISIDGNNQVEFVAVWKPTSFDDVYAAVGATKSGDYYKMQDITYNTTKLCTQVTDNQTTTLIDTRDSKDYTVAKINSRCWMTQNLRFSGSSINSSNTNINTTKNISWSDLTAGNTRDAARYHNSGNTTQGYWYNYAGASAMTITGTYISTEASYSICPAKWKLPDKNDMDNIVDYKDIFNPIGGGFYINGSIVQNQITYGLLWTSTNYTSNSNYRYNMQYNSSSGGLNSHAYYDRYVGTYIRCIAQN